jgi:hypothetical protein
MAFELARPLGLFVPDRAFWQADGADVESAQTIRDVAHERAVLRTPSETTSMQAAPRHRRKCRLVVRLVLAKLARMRSRRECATATRIVTLRSVLPFM